MTLQNFVPKEVTQQIEFLKKYPEYDGRGIKIGIIDLGVIDKSLPGMQKTTTGLPKIIECFGKPMLNVNTTKIVEKNDKGFIIGLTGRRMKIPSTWENPSGKWHLGSVPFEKLYEITEEHREKCFKKVKNFPAENTDPKLLKNKDIDCIVWNDGKSWHACIDTSFFKKINKKNKQQNYFANLEDVKVLSNYSESGEFAYLINKSIYCVNIINDGNLLQIECPPSDHGTFVAHIAAAYFPDKNPEENGVAPGVQIVSTHNRNIEEAFLKCIKHKVDIINFSITFQTTPSIIEIIKNMIEEHGIIITQAATNLGPCFFSTYLTLSNVSELLDQIFIIGSVFTEEMKKKIPFHESKNYPSLYNLSSKGPLQISGARGIDFVAPGAAITDFPKWFSNKNRISGGTSSATPNAAGTIACLLSALKANGIPYSPSMIKFALANTAFLPKNANKLEFGNGIIQIFDAFEFIKKFVNYFSQKPIVPRFLDEPNQRGIIFVKNEKNLSKDYLINIDLEVDKNWILKCAESGKNFIQHSKTFKNNSFNVKIDTNLLEEGSINYAEIYGIDYSNLSFGPLFYVPITVICPAAANFFIDKIITIKPGSPIHFFIKTPPSKLEYCSIGITPFGYKPKMSCFPYSPLTCECRQNMGTRWIKKNFIFNFFENKIVENMRLKENCEKYFEICFYHYESVSLSFKMEINFLQAFYK